MMVTRGDFARALLAKLDAPVTKRNLWALVAWQTAEGTKAKFNPLATTLPLAGATTFNSAGVKNYRNLEDGVRATAETLLHSDKNYGYLAIVQSLRDDGSAAATLKAVADSSWGTGALALAILHEVKGDWPLYRDTRIGQ